MSLPACARVPGVSACLCLPVPACPASLRLRVTALCQLPDQIIPQFWTERIIQGSGAETPGPLDLDGLAAVVARLPRANYGFLRYFIFFAERLAAVETCTEVRRAWARVCGGGGL